MRVHLLVAVLSYSRRILVKAFLAERQDDWLEGVAAALVHFGGPSPRAFRYCDIQAPPCAPAEGVVADGISEGPLNEPCPNAYVTVRLPFPSTTKNVRLTRCIRAELLRDCDARSGLEATWSGP